MKVTIHIEWRSKAKDFNWWIALGYGLSVDQHNFTYARKEQAIKAAKRAAKKLGFEVASSEEHLEVR
jgi:hypothetical protein